MERTSTPQWLLERIAAGDLPRAERDAAWSRLTAEDQARLAQLHASNQEILAALPAPAVAQEVRRRLRAHQARESSRARRVLPALAGICTAALAVWVMPTPRTTSASGLDGEPERTRPKGLTPKLIVHQKKDDGVVRLGTSASVRPGDVIQLSYLIDQPAYGAVVSVDGRGAVTWHLPEDGTTAQTLAPGRPVELAHSYRLDDAPSFETFYLVTSLQPFDLKAVQRAAEESARGGRAPLAPLPLPRGFTQVSLSLKKVSP